MIKISSNIQGLSELVINKTFETPCQLEVENKTVQVI